MASSNRSKLWFNMYPRQKSVGKSQDAERMAWEYRQSVMTGLPGNRMRDRKALIPDLEQMVSDYVVSNNLLGGSVIDASITHAVKDAYKAMQEAGRISDDMYLL